MYNLEDTSFDGNFDDGCRMMEYSFDGYRFDCSLACSFDYYSFDCSFDGYSFDCSFEYKYKLEDEVLVSYNKYPCNN